MKRFGLGVFIVLSSTAVLLAAFINGKAPEDTSVSANLFATIPITGKWNNQDVGLGIYDSELATFALQMSGTQTSFKFGYPRTDWLPLAGDWDGDGHDSIGLYNPGETTFYLRNTNTAGEADQTFVFGYVSSNQEFIPVAGDWTGSGKSEVGLYDQTTGGVVLRSGDSEIKFNANPANKTWLPFVGDWDRDGKSTISFYDPSTHEFHLRNENGAEAKDLKFTFDNMNSSAYPVAGDWDHDSQETIGLYSPASQKFFLRNSNESGGADITISVN